MSRRGKTAERPPCPRWCDYSESRKHPSAHIAHIADVVSSVYSPVRVLALTVEAGLGEVEPLPVLAMLRDDTGAMCQYRMAWSEAEQVGRALLDAKRRYGG